VIWKEKTLLPSRSTKEREPSGRDVWASGLDLVSLGGDDVLFVVDSSSVSEVDKPLYDDQSAAFMELVETCTSLTARFFGKQIHVHVVPTVDPSCSISHGPSVVRECPSSAELESSLYKSFES
jgi:hypothetical protein